jgi:hypothetical protein
MYALMTDQDVCLATAIIIIKRLHPFQHISSVNIACLKLFYWLFRLSEIYLLLNFPCIRGLVFFVKFLLRIEEIFTWL